MNEIKILVVGETLVGKTSIIEQYVNNIFPESYTPTLSINQFIKNIKILEKNITLKIYDSNGIERIKSLKEKNIKEMDIIFLVYDITVDTSFYNLDIWYKTIITYRKKDQIFFVLIGNKNDIIDDRKISQKEGENYAKKINAIFQEINSNNNHELIKNLFNTVINIYLTKKKQKK